MMSPPSPTVMCTVSPSHAPRQDLLANGLDHISGSRASVAAHVGWLVTSVLQATAGQIANPAGFCDRQLVCRRPS